jgi:hypothetical protein
MNQGFNARNNENIIGAFGCLALKVVKNSSYNKVKSTRLGKLNISSS